MGTAIVTGAGGLIGSACARMLVAEGHRVIGVDNDMRAHFFGSDGSTRWNMDRLTEDLGRDFRPAAVDIRDRTAIEALVAESKQDLVAVVHAAAQPSHDWAARDPHTDFGVNALGTLTMLEAVRQSAPETPFVFCSTNKVYGDLPNSLPLVELETRFELEPGHTYVGGIREDMSIDQSMHSVFGASKVAADVLVQEYGRYFGLPTVCFRGGTLTGPQHSAAEAHGFLAYLTMCAMTGRPYTVYGYSGKQVRDALHSTDFGSAALAFIRSPRTAAVYNIGGGRHSHTSVLEAIATVEAVSGRRLSWSYDETSRAGDHVWWVGDNGAFMRDYPGWGLTYDVEAIIKEMVVENRGRWTP